jgi:hypothetical protein
LTVPLPDPLAPDEIVSHPALLEAIHEHPVGAETVTDPVPPAAVTDRDVGVSVTVQAAAD